MNKSWKTTIMTFACIGALFTATEVSAGSRDLHKAAEIVGIVENDLTGLSVLGGKAPVIAPAFSDPVVVKPAPAPVIAPAFSDPVVVEPTPDPVIAPAFSDPVVIEPTPDPVIAPAFSDPVVVEPAPVCHKCAEIEQAKRAKQKTK